MSKLPLKTHYSELCLWLKVKVISNEILSSLMLPQLLCNDHGHVQEILWVGPVFLLILMLIWEIFRQAFLTLKGTGMIISLLPFK